MAELLTKEQLAEIEQRLNHGYSISDLKASDVMDLCENLRATIAHCRALEAEWDELQKYKQGHEYVLGLEISNAIEAFRQRAIEAVRELSDNQLNVTAICARLQMLPATSEEVGC